MLRWNRNPGGNTLLVLVSVLITLVVVEAGARLLYGPPGHSLTFAARHLTLLEELPETAQFVADHRTHRDRANTLYHDHHTFSMRPLETETLNYLPKLGTRRVPESVPVAQATQVIWMFGGSTMQNFELPDERTIANLVTRELKQAGYRPHVVNYGVGTFQSSNELVKFQSVLARTPRREWPHLVLFYDGFNEAYQGFLYGAGNIQPDLSGKLSLMVNMDHAGVARYGAATWLADHSTLFKTFLYRMVTPAKALGRWVDDASPANLLRTVDVYLNNSSLIRGAARELNIDTLFVLQPLVVTKQGVTGFEQEFVDGMKPGSAAFVRGFYKLAGAKRNGDDDFVNLSGVLDHSGHSDFFDLGHIGPRAAPPIAAAMAKAVAARLGLPGNSGA